MSTPNISPPGQTQSSNLEELQRRADAIRADLDRTLHELEHKLSPREIVDRSLATARKNGGQLLQTVGTAARKHPVPFVLASAGALWLASSRRKEVASHRLESFARSAPKLRSKLRATTRPTRHLSDRIGRKPAMYGTIALALGTALGAALPASRYERNLVGRAREAVGPMLERAAAALRARDRSP